MPRSTLTPATAISGAVVVVMSFQIDSHVRATVADSNQPRLASAIVNVYSETTPRRYSEHQLMTLSCQSAGLPVTPAAAAASRYASAVTAAPIYTVGHKKVSVLFWLYLYRMLTGLDNSFIVAKRV